MLKRIERRIESLQDELELTFEQPRGQLVLVQAEGMIELCLRLLDLAFRDRHLRHPPVRNDTPRDHVEQLAVGAERIVEPPGAELSFPEQGQYLRIVPRRRPPLDGLHGFIEATLHEQRLNAQHLHLGMLESDGFQSPQNRLGPLAVSQAHQYVGHEKVGLVVIGVDAERVPESAQSRFQALCFEMNVRFCEKAVELALFGDVERRCRRSHDHGRDGDRHVWSFLARAAPRGS